MSHLLLDYKPDTSTGPHSPRRPKRRAIWNAGPSVSQRRNRAAELEAGWSTGRDRPYREVEMPSEERSRNGTTAHPDVWKSRFSAEEWERLSALRERISSLPDYRELDLDICRLEFARWLVRHGKLSEG